MRPEPSVMHSIKSYDRRTSSCGLWWWCNGGDPARKPGDITCRACLRSAPEKRAFEGEDRTRSTGRSRR